MIESLPI